VNVELAIAGSGCFVLAAGHAAIGARSVLPNLKRERMPSTSSMTLGMMRFTWHVVSLVLVGFGILLTALAWVPDADPRTLLLRWLVAFLLAATALACWQGRRRPRSLLRPPVPFAFVAIAVLCWTAST